MTQKQKIGYKVLDQNRASVVMGASKHSPGHTYSKGKRTLPKKYQGPLCVFDSINAATAFVDKYRDTPKIIVKCHYKLSKEKRVWDTAMPGISLVPQGTVLADSVTCLE